MKLKKLEFKSDELYFTDEDHPEVTVHNVNIPINKKTAKQMIAGMNERELSTMKKAIEERKNKKRVEK